MTQNEKDRFQLESFRLFIDMNETQQTLFEIADRLLTERENAEVVYKHNFYYSQSEKWGNEVSSEKGVWIPDITEEAE
ncbi:hypothetical protein [Listeria booriae]|uniref:hypothetical protein n=1 Tax=Listeria booriae TaxID=1552123 RepID=UPI001623A770|nr:hypothetical protein [Listeria booriae]MBC2196279.1 hypothetical protein [Listeria booriae]